MLMNFKLSDGSSDYSIGGYLREIAIFESFDFTTAEPFLGLKSMIDVDNLAARYDVIRANEHGPVDVCGVRCTVAGGALCTIMEALGGEDWNVDQIEDGATLTELEA